jgi:hypothetical protein
MKIAELKYSETYKLLLARLIERKPVELRYFDSNTTPSKLDTELYFFFPCHDGSHAGCGFYSIMLSVRTSAKLFDFIEGVRQRMKFTASQMVTMCESNEFRAFNVAQNSDSLTNDDIRSLLYIWVDEWVEELKSIPVRAVSTSDYMKTWAFYEEMHPEDMEVFDKFYLAQRRLVTPDLSRPKNWEPPDERSDDY